MLKVGNDSLIRRNALGALQKLSLKKDTQLLMIKHQLIQWIIMVLKNEQATLSDYSYEYATALFMNLSLRTLGKMECEKQVRLEEGMHDFARKGSLRRW